jgi:hypothetical protein
MKKLLIAMVVVFALGVVGCNRAPAYVGTYKLVMNDTAKRMAEVGNEFQKGFDSKGKQPKVDLNEAFAKMTITLTADGKATMPDPTGAGKPFEGTYTADGNNITVTSSGKETSLTFDEKAQTLTMGGGGMNMVFKKE